MTDTTKPLRDARQRVDAYLERRSKAKGLDPDSIHGFDGGFVCFGSELLVSDLRVLLARLDAAEADARRYRWLRDVAWGDGSLIYFDHRYDKDEWSAKIDAALTKGA
jgi:hypothetical protein